MHPKGTSSLNWRESYHAESVVTDDRIEALAAQIAACLERIHFDRPDLDTLARGILPRLRAPRATIAFCGRMKAGKTSLVNRLLGRPFLPVNVNPETGVPCYISPGVEDRAVAIRGGEAVPIPCSTEGLLTQSSLGPLGPKNDGAEPAARLELQLRDCPIPPQATWVDTPGLDDNEFLHLATLDVFEACDLLVWVGNSELCIISMAEMETIATFVGQFGSAGLIFLTNVISRNHRHDEVWAEYVERQVPMLRDRYAANRAVMGLGEKEEPRMLSICAIAVESVADERYGAGELNRWLHSIQSPRHAMVRAARLERTAIAVQTLAEEIARLENEFRAALAETQAQHAERAALATKQRGRFERCAEEAVETFIANLRTEVPRVAKWIAGDITPENFCVGDGYRVALDAQVKRIAARLAHEFEQALRIGALNFDQKRAISGIPVMPPSLPVLGVLFPIIPPLPTVLSFGGITLPPLPGDLLGAEKKGRLEAVEGTKRNIVEEARRVVQDEARIQQYLRDYLMEAYPPSAPTTAAPDSARLQLLQEVRAELERLHETARQWAKES